jgi:hypothetical protein
MDLKVYYKKISEAASAIKNEFAVVVSKESADGGKPGVMSEVTRQQAAKLSVEGRVRIATAEEAKGYYEALAQARKQTEEAASQQKMQFAILPESAIDSLKAQLAGKKRE